MRQAEVKSSSIVAKPSRESTMSSDCVAPATPVGSRPLPIDHGELFGDEREELICRSQSFNGLDV